MGKRERRASLPTTGGPTHKALNRLYGLLDSNGDNDAAARESGLHVPDIRSLSESHGSISLYGIPETEAGPPAKPRPFLASWRLSPTSDAGRTTRSRPGTGDLSHSAEFLAPLADRLRKNARSFAYLGTRIRSALNPWAELTNTPLLTTPSRFRRDDSSSALAEDGEHVATSSRSFMSEYGKLSRLLAACLVLGIGLAAYQEVVQYRGMSGCSPGVLWEFVDPSALSSKCADVRLLHVFTPLAARQAIGIIVGFSAVAVHFVQTWRLRKLVNNGPDAVGGSARHRRQLEFISGHWTAAASPDILAEVSRDLAQSQILAMLIVLPMTLISTTAMIQNTYDAWKHAAEATSEAKSGLVTACCSAGDAWSSARCSELCRAGFHASTPLAIFNVGILLCLVVPFALAPSRVWSPVTSMAVEITGDAFMRKMLKLPNIVMALSLALSLTMTLLFAKRYFSSGSIVALMPGGIYSASLFLSVFLAVTMVSILLWTTPWGTAAQGLGYWARSIRSCTRKALGDGVADLPRRGGILRCTHGWRYRQLILLLIGSYAFAICTLDSRVDGYLFWMRMAPVFLMRTIILFLLVFSRDEESDFGDLEREGAGFGLVVNAQDLRREFAKLVAGKESQGRVRRYKATLLRMCETMAVSYRWVDKAIPVGDLGPINMKPWHMEALIKAIDRSGCLYVWIDACGVPQEPCDMKRVLLSRMMSVYASAYVTAALLTRELSTNRYHERVWTMQEYCSSPHIMIFLQGGIEEMPDGCISKATNGADALVVHQLRHEHLSRQWSCMPVWLNGLETVLGQMDKPVAHQIYKTYQDLCRRLYCTDQADTIRALYPLLWNMPAESQEELILIMNTLTSVHGIEQEVEKSTIENSGKLWDLSETSTSAGVCQRCSAVQLPNKSVRDSVDSLSNRKPMARDPNQVVHFRTDDTARKFDSATVFDAGEGAV